MIGKIVKLYGDDVKGYRAVIDTCGGGLCYAYVARKSAELHDGDFVHYWIFDGSDGKSRYYCKSL